MLLGIFRINISAQTKEYKVEDDGFEWYKLSKYSDGHFYYGAQDKFGNTIIPIQKLGGLDYYKGYYRIHRGSGRYEKCGLVDKKGHLIIPMEYSDVACRTGLEDNIYDFPYLCVLCNGISARYNIYGKCLIPITREYSSIWLSGCYSKPNRNNENSIYWLCRHKDKDPSKYSFCDISGKEFFTTSRPYDNCKLIKHPTTGKFAIAVRESESNHWCLIDKDGNILLQAYELFVYQWPMRIRITKEESIRNLTQTELNKVFFTADWLDGNTEYFAHAAEQSMQRFNQTNEASGGNNGTAQQQQSSGTQKTVVVEHHRDPVPVQEWQACFACGGMGTMGCDNCGGSGTKYIGDRLRRCSRCNGQGIIPCNVCYGNKGQYITVYK